MSKRRFELVRALGIGPNVHDLVRAALREAIDRVAATRPDGPTVLDAGCGRKSDIAKLRGRVTRVVGLDRHAPTARLPYLDEFVIGDLCGAGQEFGESSFDIVLSTYTLEHLEHPVAALRNVHHWLRPDGTLVASTVNRRHPWVRVYLALPGRLRSRLQRMIKTDAADAHPLVGACNDPTEIRRALTMAGFRQVELQTTGYLARAWGRHLPFFGLGLLGDLIAQPFPSRRSTIVVVARA